MDYYIRMTLFILTFLCDIAIIVACVRLARECSAGIRENNKRIAKCHEEIVRIRARRVSTEKEV